MKREYLILIFLALFIASSCAKPTTPTPAPAEFEISNLVITPSEVEVGESAKITVEVSNIGETEGSYTVALKIDGAEVENKEATVAAGDSETVSFTIVKDIRGTYSIQIDSLTADLVVIVLPLTQAEINEASQLYPSDITRALLHGDTTPPEGFDDYVIEFLGQERLDSLRSRTATVGNEDNNAAAVCLLRLGISLAVAAGVDQVTVEFIESDYPVASGNTSGFFKTGQTADIMLSGIDFDNAGGPLLFNHQCGIATDGTHLILADTYNNRVLIWNSLPGGNVAPDLVLGQKNFITNNPGTGRDQMNWPVSVATDGQRIVVADTENHRILIWNSFPLQNGEAADLVIQGGGGNINVTKSAFHWPWGVWTDGQKMAITSTRGGGVLIWNEFPTEDNEEADILLKGGGDLGTPRHITSDGNCLIVGDHNAKVEGRPERGTFFWKTFPVADEQAYDFFMTDPVEGVGLGGPWLRGDFTTDGKLVLVGQTLHIWHSFPEDQMDAPDLSIQGYNFRPGDWVCVAIAGNRVYVSSGNSNKIVVYNSIPTNPQQLPDFAIGSPDIYTDTLQANFIISNPMVASNGSNLFVSSDFDKKLYVWKELPDQSGAHPDIVYSMPEGALDNVLWGNTLAMAGKSNAVYIWESLPLDGQLPDIIFYRSIGSVQFQGLYGVALDDRYFYLADYPASKIYVWEGIPSQDSEPAFVLDVDSPWKISSDGNYLTVAQLFKQTFQVYPVEGLGADTVPTTIGGQNIFNGLQSAVVAQGHLFVVDGANNRVVIWNSIEDALSGQDADIILGTNNRRPEIGRNKLFCPAAVSFDGSYLWVGETKFSERILRFSPSP